MSADLTIEGFVSKTGRRDVQGHQIVSIEVKVGRKVKGEWVNDFYRAEFWDADADVASQIQERDRVRISGQCVPEAYLAKDGTAKPATKIRFPKLLPLAAKTTDGRMGKGRDNFDHNPGSEDGHDDSGVPF